MDGDRRSRLSKAAATFFQQTFTRNSMKYTTQHKNAKISVQPSEAEDWQGNDGYEAEVTPKGCKPTLSLKNYPNASQALAAAKEAVDSDEVPKERTRFLGIF